MITKLSSLILTKISNFVNALHDLDKLALGQQKSILHTFEKGKNFALLKELTTPVLK